MENNFQPKGCIAEVNPKYNLIKRYYPHLIADMKELSEITVKGKENEL